jgi:hypothetical protein
MHMSSRSYSPLSLAPLLLLVLLGSGGCVAAGLAAVGPVLGSITALGDRTVERTIPADLSATWGATVDALNRMAVRVEQTEKSGNRWQLTGIEGDVTVYGTLERVTPSMTKLSIRVEAGSIYADKRTAEELLNQVGVSLAGLTGSGPLGAAAAAEISATRLDVLQRSIERLGTKVEGAAEAREARRPAAAGNIPAPAPAIMTTPIITIPTSAGVATVAAPPTAPRPRILPVAAREELEVTSKDGETPPVAEPALDIMAKPLRSVDTLKPVESLMVRPAGR